MTETSKCQPFHYPESNGLNMFQGERSGVGGGKHLWNVGQFILAYSA